MAREDDIKSIAYNIWQEEGCCDGREVDHWLRAERIWEEQYGQAQPAPRTRKAAAPRNTKTKTRTKAEKKA